jgi:hypothetical protein
MAISVAFAINYSDGYEFSVEEFLAVLADSTSTIKGVDVRTSNLDEVIGTATHDQAAAVTAYSLPDENGKSEEVIAHVNTHHWVYDAVNSKAATCTTEGVYAYKCSVASCPETKTEVAPKTSHVWKLNIVKAATCTEKGKANEVCAFCGTVKKDSEVELAQLSKDGKHTFTDKYGTSVAPSCDPKTQAVNLGSKALKCDVCGFVKTAKEDQIAFKDIAEYIALERANGNLMINDSFDGHNWDAWGDGQPSCAIGTNKIRWCKTCAKIEQVETDPTKRLDAIYVGQPSNSRSSLTCLYAKNGGTVNFVCILCKGAVHESQKNVPFKADMDKAGNIISYTATYAEKRGDSTINWTVTVPHADMVEIPGTRTTRSASRACLDSIYAWFRCPVCGQSVFKEAEKPAEHNWTEWKETEKNDAAETSVWSRYCKVCKTVQTVTSAKKPIEACKDDEHVWVAEAIKDYKCGTTIDRKYTCSVCNATKTEKEELDHVYGEAVVVKEATCAEEGAKIAICEYCNNANVETLEKIDHTWNEGEITKEATKEAAGEKTFTCTVCGKTKTEEVPYEVTADAKYTLTDLAYNGQTVTGKLVHAEDTKEAENLYVRVTFFLANNYYMATIGEVEADGTFSVDGVGPIEYISLVVNGNSSVNPDDVVALGSGEITVK